MQIVDSIRQKTSGFRSRLLALVSLGIIGLALTASVTTAWVTSNRAAEQMIAQGLQVATTLANQSYLALIYQSPENAAGPLEAILSFPDIIQAGIYNLDTRPLAVKPQPSQASLSSATLPGSQAQLVSQTTDAWHFIAPVITGQATGQREAELEFQLGETPSEHLGYVHVVMGKATLRDMQLSIFGNNIIIALSFALILTILVNVAIDRLTRPLYKLIQVMAQNEEEGTRVYADLKGPTEFQNLATVFNQMMASLNERDRRLREHGEMLESEVAIRTRELVEARDAALTASRHKSEFLANISHELRTPLQAIIGYTDLVREELDMEGMEENAEELERVITNAQRLLTMINNILDMAKIESGHMDIQLKSARLEEVLREACDTVKPILKHNNNQLRIETKGTEAEINIDSGKLQQIILNLLSNATKFTQNGTVTLRSYLDKNLLKIEVEDTGIGLNKDQQKIIFDEFRQIDGSTTRNFEGTGLGLAITRRFTEMMGGEISVESEQGKGALFTVFFPLPIGLATTNKTFDSDETTLKPEISANIQ